MDVVSDLETVRALLDEARSTVDRAVYFLVDERFVKLGQHGRHHCAQLSTGTAHSYVEEALALLAGLRTELAALERQEVEKSDG